MTRKLVAIAFLFLSLVSFAQVVPTSKHVFIVVEENHKYSDVVARMPYLVSLGNKYAHTLNYHADVSGSLMDYLWLSSGSSEKAFGCNGGGCSAPITSDNIFRELNKSGLTWHAYQEGLPSVGYMGYSSGLYVKRHNPAAYYSDVISSIEQQRNMVPFTQFAADVAAGTVPNYSFITPNLVNDAHNRVGATDVRLETADNWLRTNLAPLLASKYFAPDGDGLLIVTFDECDGASTGICGGNTELVYTAVVGPKVKQGATSSVLYRHENALRTMMDALGLTTSYPGAAATAVPMSDLLVPDGLTVIVPRDGAAQLTSPVHAHVTDQRASRIEIWVDYVKRASVVGHDANVSLTMAPGVHRFVAVGVEGSTTVKKVESITVIK
jgi:hypothetical protein